MMSKIGFIGIGQCGGNLINLLDNQFACLAINTSKEDLSTLNTKYRYYIPEGEGCSHDRESAIKLLKKYYRKVIEEISDKLYHQKLIYLCFSTGGGTGSGLSSLLLEMLNSTFPNKYFGCVAVLPSDTELLKPQQNAYQCYKELSNIDKLASVFTIDNNKGDKFVLNNRFVNKLNLLLDIPSCTNTKGNIDNAELYKILTTRGSIFISTCQTSNPDNLSSAIIQSTKDSDVFADIEQDKQISYMGLSLTSDINVGDLEKEFGSPFDVFTNYNPNQTISILSGLTFPKTRIKKIIDKIETNKEKIMNNINNIKNNRITDEIEIIDINKDNSIKTQSSDFSLNNFNNLDEILSKYC